MHLKTLILIPVLLVGCGKQAAKPIDAAESPIDAGVTDARVDAEPDANPLCSIVGKETVAPAPEVRVISDEEIFLADTPLGIELFDVDVVGSKLVALTREGLVVVDPNTATHHRIGHNDTSSWFPGSMATTGDEIVSLWVVGPSLNEYHVCRSAVDDDTLLQSACTHIPGPKAMSQPILRPAGVVEFYGTKPDGVYHYFVDGQLVQETLILATAETDFDTFRHLYNVMHSDAGVVSITVLGYGPPGCRSLVELRVNTDTGAVTEVSRLPSQDDAYSPEAALGLARNVSVVEFECISRETCGRIGANALTSTRIMGDDNEIRTDYWDIPSPGEQLTIIPYGNRYLVGSAGLDIGFRWLDQEMSARALAPGPYSLPGVNLGSNAWIVTMGESVYMFYIIVDNRGVSMRLMKVAVE